MIHSTLFIFLLMITAQNSNTSSITLYDFNEVSRPSGWLIVNDGVMGGLSKGNIGLDDEGNGLFWGRVSLANNGGFSLARLSLSPISVKGKNKIVLDIKGDKKKYQFRLKSKRGQMHSYVKTFETTGDWERVEIPFDELLPRFRGRLLDLPAYPAEQIEEIGLLIGNKVEEDFQLAIRSITLE